MWSVENCWHGAYANVRQIARLPEQRCWQKGEMLGSCQQRQQRGKKRISNRRQKNSFQPMFFARLPTRTRERQPERFIYLVMSPVGVEPTTDCLGGSYSIQLSYGLMCLKPGDFKVFARFQCDSYGFILVLF